MERDESDTKQLVFWEHVGVLRSYILFGGLFFILSVIALFSLGGAVLTQYLLKPLHGQTLVFLTPMAPFLFQMKIAFIAATVVSFPVWLFLVSRFVGEALPYRKRWRFLWFVLLAMFMGAGSLLVSYFYLVPVSFAAFLHFVVPGTSLMLTADSYISFYFLITTVCFVVSELPVLIVALVYVGLINPYVLAHQRRFLYIGLLILLGVITPTTDVITLLAVTVPAIILTEAGLVLGKIMYTKETGKNY